MKKILFLIFAIIISVNVFAIYPNTHGRNIIYDAIKTEQLKRCSKKLHPMILKYDSIRKSEKSYAKSFFLQNYHYLLYENSVPEYKDTIFIMDFHNPKNIPLSIVWGSGYVRRPSSKTFLDDNAYFALMETRDSAYLAPLELFSVSAWQLACQWNTKELKKRGKRNPMHPKQTVVLTMLIISTNGEIQVQCTEFPYFYDMQKDKHIYDEESVWMPRIESKVIREDPTEPVWTVESFAWSQEKKRRFDESPQSFYTYYGPQDVRTISNAIRDSQLRVCDKNLHMGIAEYDKLRQSAESMICTLISGYPDKLNLIPFFLAEQSILEGDYDPEIMPVPADTIYIIELHGGEGKHVSVMWSWTSRYYPLYYDYDYDRHVTYSSLEKNIYKKMFGENPFVLPQAFIEKCNGMNYRLIAEKSNKNPVPGKTLVLTQLVIKKERTYSVRSFQFNYPDPTLW